MLALDTSSKLASALLQYQLDRLPIDYIEKRNALVDAVTLDDARKAAQRLWGHGPHRNRRPRPQATAQPAAAARACGQRPRLLLSPAPAPAAEAGLFGKAKRGC